MRYEDPAFSIFHKQLTDEESNLILEVLDTIGQFDGLAHFEWLNKFKTGLGLKERPKIISFSNNPYLKQSNLLGTLFEYISNHVVIRLTYHTFGDEERKTTVLNPYLLKQYNSRWYLIGTKGNGDTLLNFALDRIDKVEAIPEAAYRPCGQDLTERFEDIVGVTLYKDKAVERIVFWVSDRSKDYVETKPIHGSQRRYKNEKAKALGTQYPMLDRGAFFAIDCIPNYELIRELCSFGKELMVLSPKGIQDEVFGRIREMEEDYRKVRT